MNAPTGIIDIRGKEWLAIPDAPGYEVSSDGEVRSPRRELRPATNPRTGYRHVALGRGKSRHIHVLVLSAFAGPRPDGFTASHLNGDRTDNRLTNLVWEPHAVNCGRRNEHGTQPRGEIHYAARLSAEQVAEIRAAHTGKYGSATELARRFGVSDTTIRDIIKGRTWA